MSSTPQQGPIGLIVPPAAGEVPRDAPRLYPNIEFRARGLGLGEVTPRGYDEVIDKVVGLAKELVDDGAIAVSLMGTSLSFYRGVQFNHDLVARMSEVTGKPSTTMSFAVLRALEDLGARRIVVATSYIDDVNERLVAFLKECGLEVEDAIGLGLTGVAEMHAVQTPTLVDLCERAYERAPNAEAILLSCGGLFTLDAVPQVEATTGVPVVSSSPAGFRDVVRAAGLDPRVQGEGRMLACS